MPEAIIGAIVGFVTEVVPAAAATFATAVGLPAVAGEVLGAAGTGLFEGAGLGLVEGAITGHPLQGLEYGAITGGIGGGLTEGLELGGVSPAAAGVLGGGAAGAVGGAVSGQGALTGALGGAASGFFANQGQPSPVSGSPTPGGGASAVSTAAPAGVAGAGDPGVLGAGSGGGLNLGAGTGVDPTSGALTITGGASGATQGGLNLGGGGAPALSPNAAGGALPGDVGNGAASAGLGTPGLASPGSGGGPGGGTGVGSGVVSSTPPSVSSTVGGITSAGSGPVASATGSNPGVLSSLGKNPGILLDAGLLGISALNSNRTVPGEAALTGEAGLLARQGNQMESYLTTGTLPPGLQGTVNAASDSAQAAIRSQYASLGLSGSSAETQALQAENQKSVAEGSQLAEQLFQQGLSETQMSDQIYGNLMNVELEKDQALASSVGAFSQALALMGRPVYGGAGATGG